LAFEHLSFSAYVLNFRTLGIQRSFSPKIYASGSL
jgi:hypothetical protein